MLNPQTQFTFVRSVFKPTTGQIPLSDIFDILVDGDYQVTENVRRFHSAIEKHGPETLIESVPDLSDLIRLVSGMQIYGKQVSTLKEGKTALKNRLPSVIFSGIISAGKKKIAKEVAAHSGYYILDFDHISDVSELFDVLASLPYVCLLFVSPSGDGVKALVSGDYDFQDIDTAKIAAAHKLAYTQVITDVQNAINISGIEADIVCANVNRHCFIPTGGIDEVYLNPDCEKLPINREAILQGLTYIATSTPVKLSADALLSAPDAIAEAIRKTEERYNFQNGSKHAYLVQLASWCNIFGVDQAVLKDWIGQNLIALEEITSNVFSPYDTHGELFGTRTKEEQKEAPRKSDDPFELVISEEVIKIGKYISSDERSCSELEKFIFENDRIQINAPTGSGKTTFIFERLRGLIASAAHPIIFAVPTQALAEQVSNKYNCPAIMQGADTRYIESCTSSDIIVCTEDSLHKLEKFIPTCSALIHDESHHLVSDASKGFKFKVMNRAFQLSQLAPRVVLMSATPVQAMARLGFKFIRLEQGTTASLFIHPVEVGKSTLADVFQGVFDQQEPGKIQVVFWDSRKSIRHLRRLLLKSGKYDKSEVSVISSESKSNHAVLDQIKTDGSILPGVKIILTTRLIAEGINIYGENVGAIHLVDVKNEELFVQFPARFRDLSERHVFSYRKTCKVPDQIYPANIAIQAGYDAASFALRSAQINFPGEWGKTELKARYRSGGDEYDLLFFNGETLAVSDMAILNREMIRRDNMTSPGELYARLNRKFSYISITETTNSAAVLSDEAASAIKAEDRELKQVEDQAYQTIIDAPDHALCYSVVDLGADGEIIGVDKNNNQVRAGAQNIRQKNPEFAEYKIDIPFRRLHRLVHLGFSPDQAAVLFSESNKLRTNKGYGTFENKLFVQLAIDEESVKLSQIDASRMLKLRTIREALRPLVGVEMKKDDLLQEVTSRIHSKTGVNPGRLAMKYVRELFDVDSRRLSASEDETRSRVYLLDEELTLQNLIGSYVDLSTFREKSVVLPENGQNRKPQLLDNQFSPPIGYNIEIDFKFLLVDRQEDREEVVPF